MSGFEWTSVALSVIAVILIPLCVLTVRLVVRWTRTEGDMGKLIRDVEKLVADRERIIGEIHVTMREDRAATDRRLRWLEENLWRNARRG